MKDRKDSRFLKGKGEFTSEPKYRDSTVEQIIVNILSNSSERTDFLNNREKYLARYSIASEAKNELIRIPDEDIKGAVTEYEEYVFGSSEQVRASRDGGTDGGPSDGGPGSPSGPPPTLYCAESTFADIFCDG